jgi:hypothetical protein
LRSLRLCGENIVFTSPSKFNLPPLLVAITTIALNKGFYLKKIVLQTVYTCDKLVLNNHYMPCFASNHTDTLCYIYNSNILSQATMKPQIINRRKHTRHKAKEFDVAMTSFFSGNIIDISEGGMSINIVNYNLEKIPREWNTTILSSSTSTKITNLPIKLIRKDRIEFSVFGGFSTRNVGVKFDKPSSSQQEKIKNHIAKLPLISLSNNQKYNRNTYNCKQK